MNICQLKLIDQVPVRSQKVIKSFKKNWKNLEKCRAQLSVEFSCKTYYVFCDYVKLYYTMHTIQVDYKQKSIDLAQDM